MPFIPAPPSPRHVRPRSRSHLSRYEFSVQYELNLYSRPGIGTIDSPTGNDLLWTIDFSPAMESWRKCAYSKAKSQRSHKNSFEYGLTYQNLNQACRRYFHLSR